MADVTEAVKIEIGSIYGTRTKQGLVEIAIGDTRVQVSVPKAREIAQMLNGAIEAAISDELVVRFLTTKVGLSEERAARALLDFRELRQGSRETVFPN